MLADLHHWAGKFDRFAIRLTFAFLILWLSALGVAIATYAPWSIPIGVLVVLTSWYLMLSHAEKDLKGTIGSTAYLAARDIVGLARDLLTILLLIGLARSVGTRPWSSNPWGETWRFLGSIIGA